MSPIYKTAEGERLVRARYLAFLKYWPAPTSTSASHQPGRNVCRHVWRCQCTASTAVPRTTAKCVLHPSRDHKNRCRHHRDIKVAKPRTSDRRDQGVGRAQAEYSFYVQTNRNATPNK